MTTRTKCAMALVVVLALAATACGDSTRVGNQELLDFEPQATDGVRLGERTEAPSPSPRAVARAPKQQKPKAQRPRRQPQQQKPQPPPKQQPRQQEPAPQQKPQGPQVALDIRISGDQSGTSQFDPSAARIFEGTCARWKNTDEVARSVEADDGAFESGSIKPGGEFVWCPKAVGRFNYHDGTRPYAVAYIEVVKR